MIFRPFKTFKTFKTFNLLARNKQDTVISKTVTNSVTNSATNSNAVTVDKRKFRLRERDYHDYLKRRVYPESLQARHCKHMRTGAPDITTPLAHIEIKRWNLWKHAVGQLKVYGYEAPKPQLIAYMFGKYPARRKATAVECMRHLGIDVYDMIHDHDIGIVIRQCE